MTPTHPTTPAHAIRALGSAMDHATDNIYTGVTFTPDELGTCKTLRRAREIGVTCRLRFDPITRLWVIEAYTVKLFAAQTPGTIGGYRIRFARDNATAESLAEIAEYAARAVVKDAVSFAFA